MNSQPDLGRIKRNVSKMVGMGAPEEDIDAYIAGEGTTVDAVRAFRPQPSAPDSKSEEAGWLSSTLGSFADGVVKRGVGVIQAGADLVGAEETSEAASKVAQRLQKRIDSKGAVSKGAGFVGDIAPTLLVPAGGTGVAGRMVAGAVGGVAEGATRAQEVGGLSERVNNTATGALTGAIAAPVAGAAMDLAGSAARGIKNAVTSVRKPAITGTTNAVVGDIAGGVDDVGRNKEAQGILKKGYEKLSGREDAAWNKVRTQAAESRVSPKTASSLVDSLVNVQNDLTSNDAAGVIDRQIARIGRFISENQEVPAAEIIGIRQTLSKASRNDGGLYKSVQEVEKFINEHLNVPALKPALNLSRERFTTFEGPKAVAAATEEGATPERFGRALFGASSPANAPDAAKAVQEVLKASGGQKKEMQALLDQSVSHRILQVARQSDGEKIWIGKAANEITNLRKKNPSLWAALSPDTRTGLAKLEGAMRRDGEAGALNKVGDFAFSLLSRGFRPLGINANIRLPSIAGPKTVAEFDEVLRYLAEPEIAREAIRRGGMVGATSSGIANGILGDGEEPPKQRPQPATPQRPTATKPETSGTADEEGFKPRVYKDTRGIRTVGKGFNMQQAGARRIWEEAGIETPFNDVLTGREEVTEEEADRLHDVMMDKAAAAAPRLIKGLENLSGNRQAVIHDMLYQLGEAEAKKFAPTLKLVEKGRFAEAAARLQKTKIASQAPNRVARNAYMLEHNVSREEAEKALVAAGKIKAKGRLYA